MSSHYSSQMNNKMLPILTNIKASVLLLSHKVGYIVTFRLQSREGCWCCKDCIHPFRDCSQFSYSHEGKRLDNWTSNKATCQCPHCHLI